MVEKNELYVNNNKPFKSNVFIIVTSWDGHLMFLRETLKQYQKTGAFVICSYDRRSKLPPSYVMDYADAWVFKHKTYGAPKRNGWLWDIVYGGNLIANEYTEARYIFTVNSDCIWEKPECMNDLIEYMGENSIMSASSNGSIHTCAVLFKDWAFRKFTTYVKYKLELNKKESYSPEALLRDWVNENVMDKKVCDVQPMYPENHRYEGHIDHYSAYNQDSTWKRIIGYRNLGAEHRACPIEHLEPVESKYFDFSLKSGLPEYFTTHEQNLWKYYTTNDRRWLYKFWAEGEDSYWNRRYYPLEYYGNNPLHDDSKRKELGPPSERLGYFNRKEFQSFILKDNEYHDKWKDVIEGKK